MHPLPAILTDLFLSPSHCLPTALQVSHCNCEAFHAAFGSDGIMQPAATASNLGYLAVGLYVLTTKNRAFAPHPILSAPIVRRGFGATLILIAIASANLHARFTQFGTWADYAAIAFNLAWIGTYFRTQTRLQTSRTQTSGAPTGAGTRTQTLPARTSQRPILALYLKTLFTLFLPVAALLVLIPGHLYIRRHPPRRRRRRARETPPHDRRKSRRPPTPSARDGTLRRFARVPRRRPTPVVVRARRPNPRAHPLAPRHRAQFLFPLSVFPSRPSHGRTPLERRITRAAIDFLA